MASVDCYIGCPVEYTTYNICHKHLITITACQYQHTHTQNACVSRLSISQEVTGSFSFSSRLQWRCSILISDSVNGGSSFTSEGRKNKVGNIQIEKPSRCVCSSLSLSALLKKKRPKHVHLCKQEDDISMSTHLNQAWYLHGNLNNVILITNIILIWLTLL